MVSMASCWSTEGAAVVKVCSSGLARCRQQPDRARHGSQRACCPAGLGWTGDGAMIPAACRGSVARTWPSEPAAGCRSALVERRPDRHHVPREPRRAAPATLPGPDDRLARALQLGSTPCMRSSRSTSPRHGQPSTGAAPGPDVRSASPPISWPASHGPSATIGGSRRCVTDGAASSSSTRWTSPCRSSTRSRTTSCRCRTSCGAPIATIEDIDREIASGARGPAPYADDKSGAHPCWEDGVANSPSTRPKEHLIDAIIPQPRPAGNGLR